MREVSLILMPASCMAEEMGIFFLQAKQPTTIKKREKRHSIRKEGTSERDGRTGSAVRTERERHRRQKN